MIIHSLITAFSLMAAMPEQALVDAGNDAYAKGDYILAISHYERVIADGSFGAGLYLNLGNAYFQAGFPGIAMAQYQRALHVQPGLEEAAHNLAFVRAKVPGARAQPFLPTWRQLAARCRLGMDHMLLSWTAVLVWLIFWVSLARSIQRTSRTWIGLTLLSAMLTAVFGLAYIDFRWPATVAVVAADPIPVRYTTDESETVQFELREGDSVLIDSWRGPWVRVKTASGDRGWALTEHFAIVGSPYGVYRSGIESGDME
ncbi:MAG: BatD protein [Candidatus Hydrogenedentota bacterium]